MGNLYQVHSIAYVHRPMLIFLQLFLLHRNGSNGSKSLSRTTEFLPVCHHRQLRALGANKCEPSRLAMHCADQWSRPRTCPEKRSMCRCMHLYICMYQCMCVHWRAYGHILQRTYIHAYVYAPTHTLSLTHTRFEELSSVLWWS